VSRGVFIAALIVLLGSAVGIQVSRDRVYPVSAVDDRLLYVQSGRVLDKVALSYDALLADVYWIRALQHFGGARGLSEQQRRYDLLYPLLDLTTSLDPHFSVAYRFGAIFLSEPFPSGAGRPDQAIALLEKGVKATPDSWEYCHDIGFTYYWHLHNYAKAAEWFERGGNLPNGPWWLKTYAAIMLTRGGDRRASRFMWQQMLQSSEDGWLRQNAELRLMQLDALDQIDQLKKVVAEFTRRTGRTPETWEQIVSAGILRGVPNDPTGTPYQLNFASGEVTISGASKLSPLPTEPAAAPELAAPQNRL
jgi:hypothetical protein